MGTWPHPQASDIQIGKWIGIAAAVGILYMKKQSNWTENLQGGSDAPSPASPSTANAPQTNDGSYRIALLPFEVNAAKEEDKWIGGGMDNELKAALNKIDVTIIAGLSVNTWI